MAVSEKGAVFLQRLPSLQENFKSGRLEIYACTFCSQTGHSAASMKPAERAAFLERNPEWAAVTAFGAAAWVFPAGLLEALGHKAANIGSPFDFMSDDHARDAVQGALGPFGLCESSSGFSLNAFEGNDWGLRIHVVASQVNPNRSNAKAPAAFAQAMRAGALARAAGAISQATSDLVGEGVSLSDAQSVVGFCVELDPATGIVLSRQESPYGGSRLDAEGDALVRQALALARAAKEARELGEALMAPSSEPQTASHRSAPRI